MSTANIQISGTIQGLPAGYKTIATPPITNSASSGREDVIALPTNTDITVTPPATAVGCIIIITGAPPIVVLKGAGGDAGVSLDVTGKPTLLTFPVPGAAFILRAGFNSGAGAEIIWF